MTRFIAIIAFMGALAAKADTVPRHAQETPARWQFAGENQGIRFYFKIANECRDAGAQVDMKLENTLDHGVTVAFRLVDPDWRQSFERDLGPLMKDTAVKFTPDEGTACHPYVDEVYVQARETQVSHADESSSDEKAQSMETPDPD